MSPSNHTCLLLNLEQCCATAPKATPQRSSPAQRTDPIFLEIQKNVNPFPISDRSRIIADQISDNWMGNKRSVFQDEDYLTRMALTDTQKPIKGDISLEVHDWELRFKGADSSRSWRTASIQSSG
jgi:hypothetical protein